MRDKMVPLSPKITMFPMIRTSNLGLKSHVLHLKSYVLLTKIAPDFHLELPILFEPAVLFTSTCCYRKQ